VEPACFVVLMLEAGRWMGSPKSCAALIVEAAATTRRNIRFRLLISVLFLVFAAANALAQGGPPYYTNDPGTPGPLNWEINIGYMPFLYSDQSVSHTLDVDINFGVGERLQLTYENAWLRVKNPSMPTEYGMGQSNPGVKWRFYDAGESGLSVSVFPQLFVNNPNDAVRRGITPPSEAFLLPVEFSRKFGPTLDVDYEIGYQFVHKGRDGWLTGLVVGHEFAALKRLEAISPISSVILVFNFCCRPNPTNPTDTPSVIYQFRDASDTLWRAWWRLQGL
jgi:hypothetical protein